MKQMRRYWFLGVVVIMALLFAGMTFAGVNNHPRSKSAHFESLDRAVQQNGQPVNGRNESICDNSYYWQGGECWTIDTDGNAMVWGAGGSVYFASASDPTNCVEIAWWEAPLRIRVHNGYAYVFAYDDTSVFDVTDPLNPSLVGTYAGWNDGPGYFDAIPSTNDDYLFMTRQDTNGFDVYELATGALKWEVPNTNPDGAAGWDWWDMFLVEDKGVLILGNMKGGSPGYFDFFDVSDIDCVPPQFLYSLEDKVGPISGLYHTGLIFYKNGYLYGNYEPWQIYHPYIDWAWGGGFAADNFAEVSVWHVPDVLKPWENYFVKHYWDGSYDIVSMKDTGEGILLAHYQNRVGHYTDQFETHLKSGFFGTTIFKDGMYDGCYFAQKGGVAAGSRGARFFDNTFVETGNRWTGGRTTDVVAWGDYLFVPSGAAGLAIIDNSDPTAPTTYSWLAATDQVTQIAHVAVSNDGKYAFISDSYVDPFLGTGAASNKFWVVDLTNMAQPKLVSSTPYLTNAGNINFMSCIGNYLIIGTTVQLELYSISSGTPVFGNFALISGGCQSVKKFEHPSYPDQDFIGVLGTDWFYTFYINGGVLTDTGNMPAANFTNNVGYYSGAVVAPVTPFNDFALVNQHVYITDNAGNLFPLLLTSQSPNIYFSVSDLDTYVMDGFSMFGYTHPKHFVAQVNTYQLAMVADDGYGDQMIWGINVQEPRMPVLLPDSQWGVYPFTGFTGFSDYYGGYLYYSDYLMGTAGLFDIEDYDNPYYITNSAGEYITVASYSINDAYSTTTRIIQGTVTLTVQVQDDTTAIPGVIWYYVDLSAGAFRRLGVTAKNTPAGEVGTYTYTFDTTKWRYGNEGYFMALIQDSGCNYYYNYDAITYHINALPTYEIDWTSAGCNAPSWTDCQLDTWIICGDLDFDIWAFAYPHYMIPTHIWELMPYPFPAEPDINVAPDPALYIDDVSQIAYSIDDGAFVLYPVPYAGVDGDARYFMQHITIDTTLLADGLHTLKVRIADDCGLHGFEDIYGQSEWTFNVNNNGPQPYMTAPMAGDVVRGADVRVAAKMHNELAERPVSIVRFYLDSTDTTTIPQIIATGTYIGSATAKDEFGEYSFSWDASAVPYGDHILVAVVWEDDPCSCGPYRTPIVSFNLVSYTGMTVSVTAAPTSGVAPLSTVLTASVTGGQSPYSYAWNFGDSQTGTGNVVSHTYTTAGTFTATCTVTDNTGTTATDTVSIVVTAPACTPPTISAVAKRVNPFRLKVWGSGFQPGCVVKINGTPAPYATTWKNSGLVVAKRGAALKALCPKGVTVQVTVTNPDGCVSASFPYTR